MDSFLLSFASMLVALAVVLAIAWIALRLLRGRLPGGRPSGKGDDGLRFVRALQLGTKERVVIVEHGGERWMLGVTAGSISTIAHWPQGQATAATQAAAHTEQP